MPKKKTQPTTLTSKEINEHPLLTREQLVMCRTMNRTSKECGDKFTMLDFAGVVLRATGNIYAELKDGDDTYKMMIADQAHRHAAVLFVYEALRACDVAIVKEWPEFDEMLKNLVYLNQDLP